MFITETSRPISIRMSLFLMNKSSQIKQIKVLFKLPCVACFQTNVSVQTQSAADADGKVIKQHSEHMEILILKPFADRLIRSHRRWLSLPICSVQKKQLLHQTYSSHQILTAMHQTQQHKSKSKSLC